MKTLTRIAAALALACSMASSAYATSIADPNVVSPTILPRASLDQGLAEYVNTMIGRSLVTDLMVTRTGEYGGTAVLFGATALNAAPRLTSAGSAAGLADYLNTLLGLSGEGGAIDYTGDGVPLAAASISRSARSKAAGASGTGLAFLFGPYDRGSAGAVVFYLSGKSFDVPAATISTTTSGPTPGPTPGPAKGGGSDQPPPRSVPDGGSTVVLLGAALVAFEALRRRLGAH